MSLPWITHRLPTRADADENGRVVVLWVGVKIFEATRFEGWSTILWSNVEKFQPWLKFEPLRQNRQEDEARIDCSERFELLLSKRLLEGLRITAEKEGIPRADVVRRALGLYARALEAEDQGQLIGFANIEANGSPQVTEFIRLHGESTPHRMPDEGNIELREEQPRLFKTLCGSPETDHSVETRYAVAEDGTAWYKKGNGPWLQETPLPECAKLTNPNQDKHE